MTDFFDEKSSAEERLKQRLKIEREAEDIKHVMSLEQGRRFIWLQLTTSGVFSSSFNHDPYVTAFNEGNRNRGLALLNDIMTICPERYLEMAEEARKEQEKNNEFI
ncbi:hypothetical protein QE177_09015 [Arsenophonus sp. aPb]|uniref:Bbp19 family protein n=1 Tax=Arsenophonus sp. aPb TaxID=3041619 RepID=UPI002468E3FA|nr:hypothetical protein [Arsenophonus sp. aPb]WGL97362.1 hypothetical protein QE177_09015 [Arsenophonus sp. aPb]